MLIRRIQAVAELGRSQIKNLLNFLLGRPMVTPSFGCMTLDHDDIDVARMWLKNKEGWFNQETVRRYEAKFREWNGSKYAFAFMSGREALSACIYALGLKPGDEVILPGYTCVVVPNAFHFAGIKTIYSDIELDTYGLDVGFVERKITDNTRAILIHHLYGLVCRDYLALLDLARRRGLRVIEDCAHATGAEYKGTKVGNRGDLAFYSTEQSKVLNTIQGGVAVTNDRVLAERLQQYYELAHYPDESWIEKQLYNVFLGYFQHKHPQRWLLGDIANLLYGHKFLVSTTPEEEKGIRPPYYGRRMANPIAALGLNQLKKVDHYNELRRQTAKVWDKWSEANGYIRPLVIPDSTPVFLRYPILVEPEKKQNTAWAYQELRVSLGVWFKSNIHPVQWSVEGCPNANIAVNQCVNLPCLVNVA